MRPGTVPCMQLDPSDFPGEYRLCAVCGRPLDGVLGKYVHLQEGDGDHVPVPVRVGELPYAVIRCDFCNEDVTDGGWVLPATDFPMSVLESSLGNWAVCGGCLSDVRRRRWSTLASRAVGVQRFKADAPAVRKEMLRIYRLLEVHITGAPYPAVVVPEPDA